VNPVDPVRPSRRVWRLDRSLPVRGQASMIRSPS
jgi:hypothetical protein